MTTEMAHVKYGEVKEGPYLLVAPVSGRIPFVIDAARVRDGIEYIHNVILWPNEWTEWDRRGLYGYFYEVQEWWANKEKGSPTTDGIRLSYLVPDEILVPAEASKLFTAWLNKHYISSGERATVWPRPDHQGRIAGLYLFKFFKVVMKWAYESGNRVGLSKAFIKTLSSRRNGMLNDIDSKYMDVPLTVHAHAVEIAEWKISAAGLVNDLETLFGPMRGDRGPADDHARLTLARLLVVLFYMRPEQRVEMGNALYGWEPSIRATLVQAIKDSFENFPAKTLDNWEAPRLSGFTEVVKFCENPPAPSQPGKP